MNDLQTVKPQALSAAADAEVQRSIAEVQGAIILAKKFPRDIQESIKEIMEECSRPALAEVAIYDYAKGGTSITGASIRLVEVIALCWGNIQSGWRELDRKMINGNLYAEIEAFAWDMERNRREALTFKVKLVRDTKKGSWPLKDEREIYEHCANQAARRKRSCIEALIPGYVKEPAIDRCRETVASGIKKDTVPKMVKAFEAEFGVTQQQIETFIQRDLAAIQPGQVVRLRQIYNSLKDKMAGVADYFEPEKKEEPKAEKKSEGKGNKGLKEKLSQHPKSDTDKPKDEPESTQSSPMPSENSESSLTTSSENSSESSAAEDNRPPDNVDPDTGEVMPETPFDPDPKLV